MAAEEDFVGELAAEMEDMDVEPPAFLDPSEVGEEVDIEDAGPGDDDDDDDDDAEDAATRSEGGEDDDSDEDPMIEIEDDSVQGFFDHTDSVYCVALNPAFDDIVCTGGGDDRAFLWDRTSGDCAYELKGAHNESVAAVCFNFDGSMCATASLDGQVSVWDVKTGELVVAFEGPEDGIEMLAFHHKGNALLGCSADGTAFLWNAKKDGLLLHVFAGHSQAVTSGAFTYQGNRVVTVSMDETIRVWNPKSGQLEKTLHGHGFHFNGINCLDLHPTQPIALTGDTSGLVLISHLQTGKSLAQLKGHRLSVETVGFSHAHPYAASAGHEHEINVWDTQKGDIRQTLEGHEDAVTKVLWHPKVPLLYSSSMDGTVKVWDARTGKAERNFRGHREPILDFDITSDGKQIVSVSDDKTALVFSLV
mmetsp:Transcript_28709/g.72173  ORF Transcript_28709/g.72173 Transcript_28709/m.72173 type:complete len:419 (-) Transcript_28709:31-1287(-)